MCINVVLYKYESDMSRMLLELHFKVWTLNKAILDHDLMAQVEEKNTDDVQGE